MAPMRLEIITAEREVYADDVDIVVAPGIEGQLGILPHHAPLMTALQPGEILIRKDGEPSYLAVTGGFMEVMANKVTILAEACEYSEEINEERGPSSDGAGAGTDAEPYHRPGVGTSRNFYAPCAGTLEHRKAAPPGRYAQYYGRPAGLGLIFLKGLNTQIGKRALAIYQCPLFIRV